MPTFTNGVLRDFPRVNVPRGYAGNEPQAITKSAPVNSSATIKSGQPIALVSDEWVQADDSHSSSQIYIAYHDSDDTDVQSCGKLLGFSVLGEFEIETPWVQTNGLAVGDQLVVNSNNDLCKIGNAAGGTAGTEVVGYVSEIRDLGVLGHTSENARGGVVGTIPEDSTANGAYGLKIQVSDVPGTGGTLILEDHLGASKTWTVDQTLATSTASKIGTNGLTTAEEAASAIADAINTAAKAFNAYASGATVNVWQTAPGSAGVSDIGAGTISNVTLDSAFSRGPAFYVVKFATSAA